MNEQPLEPCPRCKKADRVRRKLIATDLDWGHWGPVGLPSSGHLRVSSPDGEGGKQHSGSFLNGFYCDTCGVGFVTDSVLRDVGFFVSDTPFGDRIGRDHTVELKQTVTRSKNMVDCLRSFGRNEITFEEAFEILSAIIRENFQRFGVGANTRNAGAIAGLILTELYPDDPLNARSFPEFSEEAESKYALAQGCALVALGVEYSHHPEAPRAEAVRFRAMVEQAGLLPPLDSVEE